MYDFFFSKMVTDFISGNIYLNVMKIRMFLLSKYIPTAILYEKELIYDTKVQDK